MRIAIIGGVGSGKSTVLDIIKRLGHSVVSTDELNRELLSDPQYLRLLSAAFPDAVKVNVVDKEVLRNEIFSDRAKRLIINNIAHPIIKRKVLSLKDDPLFVEVPLIAESGMAKDFDELILVSAKTRIRLKRIKERPGIKQIAKKIIDSQLPEKKLKTYATITIYNNGTEEELECSVKKVLDYIFSKK